MRNFVVFSCLGLALLWSTPAWASGDGGDALIEDSLRTLNQRIKELEDQVSRLKEQPAPAAVVSPTTAECCDPIDKRLTAVEEGLGLLKGIEFGGMVYSSYTYNFNEPDSRENSLRIFDKRHNSFSFDLFQLQIAKQSDSGIGFASVLNFGKTASGMASDWTGDGSFEGPEEGNDFEVQEAYLTYNIPLMNGVEMKAGKFVTLLGAEVIEAPYNYNISRSFLFGYAIPFTHTGVLFSHQFTDQVGLTAGIVNGFDNVVDNNNGKSFLGSLALEPFDGLSWSFNGIVGDEQTDNDHSTRGVFDTVLTYSPRDHLEFNFNYDYGKEGDAGLNGQNATWQGFSGIVSIGGAMFNPGWEPFSFAVRSEWFSDEDGARTGTKQDIWEVTTTAKWQLTEHMQVRFEYRHDESDKKSFDDARRVGKQLIPYFRNGQDTLAAEVAYLF